MKVYSQLVSAQAENKASDYSSGTKGRYWFNTSTSLLKYDSGSAVKTVVSTDDTQTLTNKSLSDSTSYIIDNSDATKKAQFECSGISTTTTRTYTFPDGSTTFVGTGLTQTLSNKKFSDPTTHTEVSTPSTPSSNDWKLYFKTDGLYQLDDTGTETKFANNLVAYSSKTHADTGATLAEGFYLWTLTNGSNDTATIPAASSNGGKIIKVKLAATTASFNTLTLGRSSSDTFTLADGTASATSLVMYTAGEEYELLSDGSSVWQVLNHRTATGWTSFTMTIGGSTSAPTKSTTPVPSTDLASWRRVGDSIEIRYDFRQNGTGGANGTGVYLFPIVGLTADTAKITVDANGVLGNCGPANVSINSAAAVGFCYLYNSTNIAMQVLSDTAAQTAVGSATYNLGSSTPITYSFIATIPITGWKA